MQVKHGWSGEVKSGQWSKLDVVLDEMDLQRIVATAGWPYPLSEIPVAIAYQLLDVEAEYLLTAALYAKHNIDALPKLHELDDRKTRLLAQLRSTE